MNSSSSHPGSNHLSHSSWQQEEPASSSLDKDADYKISEGITSQGFEDTKMVVNVLPTKVFQVNTDSTTKRPFPNASVRWTALPALEWIESLAAATEQGEGCFDRITIGDVRLGAPSPVVPVAPAAPPNTLAAEMWKSVPAAVAVRQENHQKATGKRVHEETRTVQEELLASSCDLSYIWQRDPVGARHFLGRLHPLAVQVETQSVQQQQADLQEQLQYAYGAVKELFHFKFGRILDQCPYGSADFGESRMLVNVLYDETIQKMQNLLKRDKAKESDEEEMATLDTKLAAVVAQATAVETHVPKKDFSEYMTTWLRENWTNPYPDEDGLAEMAATCGTTAIIVSNWLINARTRKWRPAIVKATDMGRPSELLLEDSIRIFDGRPLRHLEEHVDDRTGHDDDGTGYCRSTRRVKRSRDGY